MKKRIKDLEDFALLDPTFFIALKGANTCFADFTYQTMGMGYYAHSAEKYVTNVTQELYEKAPTDAKTYLTNILTAKYGDNWKRLKEALIDSVYDPIENYLMNEKNIKDETTTTFGKKVDDDDTITFGKVVDDDDSITFGKKIDDDNTLTKTGKEKTQHEITKDDVTATPGVTTTTEGDVYGYNSSTSVPSDKRVERKSGKDIQEHELSESDELSFTNRADTNERDYQESGTEGHEKDYRESGTEGHQKDYQESGTEKVKHDYEFERRGNIGVTTSQQMLQSEIELRKWSFLESVYSDIDKILTLQTY